MFENVSRQAWFTAGAAAAGVAFIGYCIYFDHKRRSAPDFKQKLREKRRKEREAARKADDGDDIFASGMPQSASEMQAFFMQELQIGEEMLASGVSYVLLSYLSALTKGNIDKGIKHMANAVALCGQPQQIMQVLNQTLPQPVFQQLMTEVPRAQQRIMIAMMGARNPTEAEMVGNAPINVTTQDVDELEILR